ncbi:MAG: O-antigen ligase family protein [Verrucomicrobia bacterium]|nr:O-antigen ligase family protein [Verrucomicrobiota bacterium]
MNRETLDRGCEWGILVLVLAILVLGPLGTGAVRPLEFAIIQGLTLGVMVLWGARLWLDPRPQLFWPPICWAVAAFTLYAIGRYLTADIEYVARQELIHILVYAFLFLAILNNLYRQESTQIISCALVFLAMAISFYAIYQFLTHSHRVWNFYVRADYGASGTYISRNHLGGFLEMVLPLGLAFTLTSRLKPVVKVFLGYASLVILVGIAVTVSRGTYASAGVALLLFFGVLMFRRTYRLPSIAMLVVILGAGAYFLPRSLPVQARFKQMVEGAERVENDVRFMLWRAALQVWQKNVWWGVGPGHYDYRFREVRPAEVQLRPGWAHNDYLNVLAEWGITGTALVTSAWVLLGLGVLKTWSTVCRAPRDLGEDRGKNKFALVLGTSVGLAAILVHSVVDFNMHIPANAIIAITLMALLSGGLRFATERYWFRVRTWGKVVASVFLLMGAIYLGYHGWRHATEYVWLKRAGRATSFSPAQVELLKKAFAIEPMNAETACDIGEALRQQSSDGGSNYRQLAEQAMEWFDRSIKLNPWGAYSWLSPCVGYGWCLDWLERFDKAEPYFQRADELDPNSYFVAAHIGQHYVESGNLAAAKPWFERSLRLQWQDNDIARKYLEIVNRRLLEGATNEISPQLRLPAR